METNVDGIKSNSFMLEPQIDVKIRTKSDESAQIEIYYISCISESHIYLF